LVSCTRVQEPRLADLGRPLGADRLAGAGLAIFRAIERVAAFGLLLRSVMGSSRFVRRHPPHRLSPARASTRRGRPPKLALAASSHHNNAPFRQESQSILAKMAAYFVSHFDPDCAASRKNFHGLEGTSTGCRFLIPPCRSPNPTAPARQSNDWRCVLVWLRKLAVAGFCELTIGLWASKLLSPEAKPCSSSAGDRDFVVVPFVICDGRANDQGHAPGI
jgi:hypothetical protein